MRVVSQDGRVDVNYDNAVITTYSMDAKNVIAKVRDEYLSLAEYTSEENALKAMEMLRRSYVYNYMVFLFPRDDEVEAWNTEH